MFVPMTIFATDLMINKRKYSFFIPSLITKYVEGQSKGDD